jgi:hypothetical protein
MLQFAVPRYHFIPEKLLLYYLKLPSVRATGKKLNIWNKEHIHSRKYLLAIFSLKYFLESNNKNSTYISTKLEGYRHLHLYKKDIYTIYILPIPMSQFTIMLTYCKSSYVHL